MARIDTPTGLMYNENRDLQNELFWAAKENKINLYHFDSFLKEPKKISYSAISGIIESSMLSDFPKWNASQEYWPGRNQYDGKDEIVWMPASTVAYNNKLYDAIKQNIKTIPTDTVYWEHTPPTIIFQSVVLDFVTTQEKDTILQYVHYFYNAKKYCFSFKASEVVPLLNSTNNVWFSTASNFASHVVGDFFMIEPQNGYKMFNELWPLLDTVALGIKKQKDIDYPSSCDIQMSGGKINGFVLGNGDHKVYGKVPRSKIAKFIEGDRPEFYLRGDALANFKMIPLSKALAIVEFKSLSSSQEIPKGARIEQMELIQYESFDFRDQDQDNKFVEDMNRFLHLIYEGVSENKVRVYKDESVKDNYSANELVKFWAHNKIDEWRDDTNYLEDQTVSYHGEFYTSVGSDRNYDNPETNTQKWEKGKIAIVQPESVRLITFNSRTVYDVRGNQLEKEYLKIQIGQLGYFRFDELKAHASKANPILWKNVFKWMDDHGVFELKPISLTMKK